MRSWLTIVVLVLMLIACLTSALIYEVYPIAAAVIVMYVLLIAGGALNCRSKVRRHKEEIAELKDIHQKEITQLTEDRISELEKVHLTTWLQGSNKQVWHKSTSEVEMETKFIFPLLRSLDYKDTHMSMRVPMSLQKGSSEFRGEADWVVWNDSHEALLVIEAKAPRIPIEDIVVQQARSYAIWLEAPVYILTNGEEVQVFHRGVIKDSCVFECSTENLGEEWDRLEAVAGKSAVLELRERLVE